ncbi:hypothetical protein BPAE_0132g00240 [Botrytis paeoniae]|uniref:Uncharacterized protein n=1 Tax=Botrytis paeoniae TaxID=278948 RepID=A0A4Z1FEZ9_9HELO|nr:hypothetical protein BPAE_0132g00240 [Botrytis paeoniae]
MSAVPGRRQEPSLQLYRATWRLDLSILLTFRLRLLLKYNGCQIPNVPSLARLSLQSRGTKPRAWPSTQASRWPYVRRPRDIAYRHAHILAKESNSLRYIKIGEWAWRIKQRSFALEELDDDEKEAIYLFNLPKLISESALGGRRNNLDFESSSFF